jgi:hypothetical protein
VQRIPVAEVQEAHAVGTRGMCSFVLERTPAAAMAVMAQA